MRSGSDFEFILYLLLAAGGGFASWLKKRQAKREMEGQVEGQSDHPSSLPRPVVGEGVPPRAADLEEHGADFESWLQELVDPSEPADVPAPPAPSPATKPPEAIACSGEERLAAPLSTGIGGVPMGAFASADLPTEELHGQSLADSLSTGAATVLDRRGSAWRPGRGWRDAFVASVVFGRPLSLESYRPPNSADLG